MAVKADFPGEFEYGGWVRADYGNGNRYDAGGDENLGMSQAAFKLNWSADDVEAYVLIGAINLIDDDIGNKRKTDVKAASLTLYDVFDSDVSMSIGLQPLLFGLKGGGFPGDRSIQASIEFGGTGAMAVSRQAAPSVIFSAPIGNLTARGGFFDINSDTEYYFLQSGLGNLEGSSLDKNYFAELIYQSDTGDGFYGTFGIEGYYIGGSVDSTRPIYDFGLGFRKGRFDVSVEQFYLDSAITNTLEDETYSVAEFSYQQNELTQWYVDYAQADQLDTETFRLGVSREINKYLSFLIEYSRDELGLQDNKKVDSIDFRLQFKI